MSLSLSEEMVRRVDDLRGLVSRSRFVEEELEKALGAPVTAGRDMPRADVRQPAPSRASVATTPTQSLMKDDWTSQPVQEQFHKGLEHAVCLKCRGAGVLRGVDGPCPGCGGSGKQ